VEEAEFVWIKEQTNATSGNLSIQIEKLREVGYIDVKKLFKGKIPCTVCRITPKGISAFEAYTLALQDYVNRPF
jgi:hypothetical protein